MVHLPETQDVGIEPHALVEVADVEDGVVEPEDAHEVPFEKRSMLTGSS